MVPLLKPDRCPTCKFVDRQPGAEGQPMQFFCRRHPPQMATLYTVVPGQNGMQPMVFGSITSFPKVETDWTCGEYVRGFLKPSDAPSIDDIATQPINGGN